MEGISKAVSGMVRLALRCICFVVVIFVIIVVRLSPVASCVSASCLFVFLVVPSNR